MQMLSSQQVLVFRLPSAMLFLFCFALLVTETSSFKTSTAPDEVRLVEGGGHCSGRLEVKYQGEWRTMNAKYMSVNAIAKVNYGQVVCRQLGCGSVISLTHNPSDSTHRSAWEVQFNCHGTESTLRECKASGDRRKIVQVQGQDTSNSSLEVICSESVRLVMGSDRCAGNVQVKSAQSWTSVCDTGFDAEAAKVVCRELGCGAFSSTGWLFVGTEGPMSSKRFQCAGNESLLQDCATSTSSACNPGRAAGVICREPYDVRLVEGESRCEGILEGKYQGEWRQLHDLQLYWDLREASIVCRNLDCGSAISTSRSRLSKGQHAWEISGRCFEHWSSEDLCEHWRESTSGSSINVTCAESVRMVNGPGRCKGKLQVKSDETWASVCYDNVDWKDGMVICRELGCGFYHTHHWTSSAPIWSKEFNCTGRENRLLDCATSDSAVSTCSSGQTTLMCKGHPDPPDIILYSSSSGVTSRLFKGHSFAISCSAKAFPYSIRSFRLTFDDYGKPCTEWTQPAVNDSAYFLFPAADDTHEGTYRCTCSYDEAPELFSKPKSRFLYVQELNDVKLVNGDSHCTGRLEVGHQREWRPMSYWDSWSMREASVVCKQLNCGSAVSTAKIHGSANPLPTWRFFSGCDGSEVALMGCGTVKTWRSSATVEVVCSDLLLQPNITLYSFMDGLPEDQQQDVDISMGSSFTISCSVQPQYPGGHFTLLFNQTHTQTLPAVNHSAHFLFPAADYAHQGNYSCVYHNYVFNRNFSSESQSLSLTVTERDDVMLDGGSGCAGRLVVHYQDGAGYKTHLVGFRPTVWDLKHAAIVCRQLRCGSAVSTQGVSVFEKQPMWRFFSDCDGSEYALMHCGTVNVWPSSSAVEVVCAGHQGAKAQTTTDDRAGWSQH